MKLTLVEKIANAVLYEGYMLYPYRASSVKNRQRFNWGALAPKEYSDAQNNTEAWQMRTQCIVAGSSAAKIRVKVRFLHLTNREIGRVDPPQNTLPDEMEMVGSLDIKGQLYQPWQEVIEHTVDMPVIRPGDTPLTEEFEFPASREVEGIKDDSDLYAGAMIRTREKMSGRVEASVEAVQPDGLLKISVAIKNTTPFVVSADSVRDDALLRSFVSTHAILNVENGEFVSLLEPSDAHAEAAAACVNTGLFPILAGDDGRRDCMLASPIILYDYPEIAPESPGDLFDSTEIDEILTLRIMTMTEAEKKEMRSIDDRARKILERTEFMTEEQLLTMHGTLRGMERSNKANG